MRSLAVTAALALVVALPVEAAAEPPLRGVPLAQRHAPENYGARPRSFDVASDDDGRVYVANVEGVLRFDGHDWELLRLPGGMPARSLARGPDGRMYVGSYDHFGAIRIAPDGRWRYEDLRPAFGLVEGERHVGPVWQVAAASDGVWFRAERALYFHATAPAGHRRIPLPPQARSIYLADDVLYVRVAGEGLMRVAGDGLEPVPGAKAFADQPLSGLLRHGDGLLLVGQRGFHRADARGIRHLPSEADRLFAEAEPFSARRLSDGSIAIGTYTGELQRYDASLALIERIPTGSFTIEALALDREGGLWAATEGDLLRLRLPVPWTRFDASHGLRGTINDAEWHAGALWLGSTRGIGRLRPAGEGLPQAEWFDEWTTFEGLDLQSTAHGLLVAHRDGIFALEQSPRPRELLPAADAVYSLTVSRHHPDLVYALGAAHIRLLRPEGGRWRVVATWPLEGASANELIEAGPETLWIGDARGGPQRLDVDPAAGELRSRRVHDERDGLVLDPEAGSHVFRLDGEVFVVSGTRSFAFRDGRFVEDRRPPFGQVERPMELGLVETPQGMFAHTSRTLLRRAPGARTWEPVRFDDGARRGFVAVSPGSDGIVRVSTWSALMQYEPGQAEEPAPPPLRTRLARVELDLRDEGTRRLPVEAVDAPVAMPSGATAYFSFAVVTMAPEVEFRFRIPGQVDRWSDWSAERELGVRVRPGDFRLEVEARTPDGRAIEPLVYRFHGEPRWHERVWVRALGGMALLGILVLLNVLATRHRGARLVAANRRLEQHIAERTRELQDANRRLSELAIEDALTGVSNRRALEQGLMREWQRCLELRRPLAVLMIDVDHFKRFNDLFGHLEGDAMLRRVADRLRESYDPVRELLARFGGEEFALLMPGSHLAQAQARAEELRRRFDTPESGITVSIGVAAQVPAAQDDPHGLLRRADAALYRAKRNGRNRVEIAND